MLNFRFAENEDYPMLLQYRVECGWGKEQFEQIWKSPEWKWCIFSDIHEGVQRQVGMGGWQLDSKIDKTGASKEDGIIKLGAFAVSLLYTIPFASHLSSRKQLVLSRDGTASLSHPNTGFLFIRKVLQGQGFGTEALEYLEWIAKDKLDAKYVTLNTGAYQCHRDPEDKYWIEDKTTIAKNFEWYIRHGYKEYKVNHSLLDRAA